MGWASALPFATESKTPALPIGLGVKNIFREWPLKKTNKGVCHEERYLLGGCERVCYDDRISCGWFFGPLILGNSMDWLFLGIILILAVLSLGFVILCANLE